MLHSTRALIPLLILCLLLTACGPANNEAIPQTNNQAQTSAQAQTSTQDVCPIRMNMGSTQAPLTCLTPHALRMAYGIDPLVQKGFTGKGQTIIDLVSFGSPTLQQDMDVFDQTFNLPPIDLQLISPLTVPEYDPQQDKGTWEQATVQVVEVLHAIAPEAKIILLESPVAQTEGLVGLPEYRQLQQYVIDQHLGSIVSMSWGASELTLQDAQGQQELQKWNNVLQQGTTQDHITYFAASGDTGATNYADDHTVGTVPTTSFAADSPWVTGVGGTILQGSGSTFSENAWSSSGGGFSSFYQMPSYQKVLPAGIQQLFNDRRGVPDVSAEAHPDTGLAVYTRGQWSLAGGTSASTPIWAALQAIANQMAGHPLGFINPGLYKVATSASYRKDFRDITEGNNSNLQANVRGYSAAAGWDPVTGLGTPNAAHLIPDLIAALK